MLDKSQGWYGRTAYRRIIGKDCIQKALRLANRCSETKENPKIPPTASKQALGLKVENGHLGWDDQPARTNKNTSTV